VEVGRGVFVVIHADDDSEETRDFRHGAHGSARAEPEYHRFITVRTVWLRTGWRLERILISIALRGASLAGRGQPWSSAALLFLAAAWAFRRYPELRRT
jgi:hypothetical protein